MKLAAYIAILVMLATLSSNVLHATDQTMSSSLKLYKPIVIAKVSDLSFPDTVISGNSQNITVSTASTNAATFNAQGGKNRSLTRSVVQSSIIMSAPGVTGTITVNSFSRSGPTVFDSNGNANGFKIGATARVLSNNIDGNYTGTATFRVVYQ
ncbi:MAG: DUF4402 domain-containing protein [bacterium]